MAINESLNLLRVGKRSAGPVDDQFPSDTPGPPDVLAQDDDQRELLDALDSLKPEHRAVIVLKYFADRSYEEAGQILGIEEKTVKSRLFTARQLLKERLAARGGT